MTTISICIPCYKSERFLRTTIESALAQTVRPFEILISDDHSPDGTLEIANEYRHISPVRVIQTPHRLTLGEHYRYLLQEARGDYICFLSHDDALMPDFVTTMLKNLDGDTGLLAAGWVECDRNLRPRGMRGMALPRESLIAPDGFLHFRKGCGYIISVSLFSRRLLLQLPDLPKEADLATDWYWALMLGLKGTIKFIRTPLGYYRFHDGNAAHTHPNGMRDEFMAMLAFVRDNVDAEYKKDLEDRVGRIRQEIEAGKRSEGASRGKRRPLSSLRNLVKWARAQSYRCLPRPISMAEKGVGVSVRQHRLQK